MDPQETAGTEERGEEPALEIEGPVQGSKEGAPDAAAMLEDDVEEDEGEGEEGEEEEEGGNDKQQDSSDEEEGGEDDAYDMVNSTVAF